MNKKMLILIFIVIPVSVGLILGFEMGFRRIENIPVAVFDQDHSEFSRMLTDYVSDNSSFDVIGHAASYKDMETLLQGGDAAIGIIFPEDLYKQVRQGKSPEVLVLYDGTKMHLMAFSKAALSEILMTAQAGYMKQVYEGKLSVVPTESMAYTMPLNVTYQVMFNAAKSMSNFLLPGMLAALLQVGMTIVGVEAAQESGGGFSDAVRRIGRYGTMGGLSLILCLGIQRVFFGMPYEGTVAGGLILSLLFAMCMTAFGYLTGTIIGDRVLASQISCFFVLPTSLLGGYTFPLIAMPGPFRLMAGLMAFSWYGDAIRNLTLMKLEIHHLFPAMGHLTMILAVELFILLLATGRKKEIINAAA